MLVDTHCHLELIAEKLEVTANKKVNAQTVNKIIGDARNADIFALISVGTTLATSSCIVEHFASIPEVFCAIGLHPCDASDDWQADMREFDKLFVHPNHQKIVGIGECGLDFYHPGFIVERQEAVFRAHIQMALERQLPLVVHTRNAFDATLRIVDEYKGNPPTGTFHCFSEDVAAARKVVDRGFLLGIGGPVTYPKNSMLRDVVKTVGLDHIMLETDAPFLPPQGFRGQINYPHHVATVAHYLAEFLGCSYAQVAEKTTANAQKLFKTNFR